MSVTRLGVLTCSCLILIAVGCATTTPDRASVSEPVSSPRATVTHAQAEREREQAAWWARWGQASEEEQAVMIHEWLEGNRRATTGTITSSGQAIQRTLEAVDRQIERDRQAAAQREAVDSLLPWLLMPQFHPTPSPPPLLLYRPLGSGPFYRQPLNCTSYPAGTIMQTYCY